MNLIEESKAALIIELLGLEKKQTSNSNYFWELGKDYVVRTVTMIYLGKLKAVNETELLLEDCAWIPDTSRWNEFLDGKKPNEMEPYKNDVIIGRGALLDATVMSKKITREVI
jgi:hypothetical protein